MVLLDRGGRVATYKFAVLVGLMDLCLETSAGRGGPRASVRTRALAEKVIELYWGHTLKFHEQSVLRQNTGGQAEVITLISRFRHRTGADPSSTLFRARSRDERAYARLVRDVEWKLVEMPLPKLQRIGAEVVPFIYTVAWDDHVTRGQFNDAEFDDRIRFVGRAGEHLARLSGLLRPIIYRLWAEMVARLNKLPESELDEFLFDPCRPSLGPVREPLLELQGGRCFYCGRGIRRNSHVDHFVPWARHPDNGLDNLVIAHEACNLSKSDHLASVDHVSRWSRRLREHEATLAEVAREVGWERHRTRSINVARGIYGRLPGDVRLWHASKEFVKLDRTLLTAALEGLTG